MRSRLLVIVLIMALALAGASYAARVRGQASPGVAAPNGGLRIAKDLGLSRDQATKIRDIVKKYREDVKGVLQSDLSKDEKMTKVQALKKDAGDAIMGVLTAEQQAKAKQMNLVDTLLGVHRERMPLRWALGQLGLDDAQKAKIKDITTEMQTKARAIKDDTSLTPAQKRAKFAELHKTTMDAINAVLTPAQQEKLKQLLANGGGAAERGPGTARRQGWKK